MAQPKPHMRFPTASAAFESYVAAVYPGRKISEVQRTELARAFSAGADWSMGESEALTMETPDSVEGIEESMRRVAALRNSCIDLANSTLDPARDGMLPHPYPNHLGDGA